MQVDIASLMVAQARAAAASAMPGYAHGCDSPLQYGWKCAGPPLVPPAGDAGLRATNRKTDYEKNYRYRRRMPCSRSVEAMTSRMSMPASASSRRSALVRPRALLLSALPALAASARLAQQRPEDGGAGDGWWAPGDARPFPAY